MSIKIDQIPLILMELQSQIKNNLQDLNTNKNFIISRVSLGLEVNYRTQAVLGYLHNADVNSFHHNMYLAASVRSHFLNCVRRGMTCKPEYLLASLDWYIYEALCSGEDNILLNLANDKLTLEIDEALDNPYYPAFAVGLRLLIVGKVESAREFFADFDGARGAELEGYSLIINGVLSDDKQIFNDGLHVAIEERKSEIQRDEDVNVGEQWLSVECLGLARLGIKFGLEVNINDALIPEELLGQPTMPYPSPDKILPPIPSHFIVVPEGGT